VAQLFIERARKVMQSIARRAARDPNSELPLTIKTESHATID
jgi:hypothetical protein